MGLGGVSLLAMGTVFKADVCVYMPSLLLNFLRTVTPQTFAGLIKAVSIPFKTEIGITIQSQPTPPPWRSKIVRFSQICLVLGLVWIATITPVWADPTTVDWVEQQPALSTPVDATDIPSEQVNQFVDAYLQVVALIDARDEDLKRAATESESLQIQQTTQAEAYGLIEATGLTRQTYWQLLGLANSDAEFRDRILAQLDEKG